jgi:seryl-tRNA synthetase
MLDINLIRAQPDLVKQAVQNRQDPGLVATVDAVLAQDARRRDLLKEVEALKAERNRVSKEIGRMKDPAERQAKIDEQKGLGDKIAALDAEVRQVDETLLGLVSTLPNVPDARTPLGQSEADNVVLRTVGTPKTFDFTPVPHWDLGTRLASLISSAGSS